MLRFGPLTIQRENPPTDWYTWIVSDDWTLNWGAARTIPGAVWDWWTTLLEWRRLRRRKG